MTPRPHPHPIHAIHLSFPSAPLRDEPATDDAQAWLELFYDLLFVAGMIKLGGVTKKAEMDQIMYCCLIFSLFWTMWYQLQRYMSKHHKNNLAHLALLFTQCASVSQVRLPDHSPTPQNRHHR